MPNQNKLKRPSILCTSTSAMAPSLDTLLNCLSLPHTPTCVMHSDVCHPVSISSPLTSSGTLNPHECGCLVLPFNSLQHSWKSDLGPHHPGGFSLVLRHISEGQYNSSSYPGGRAQYAVCSINAIRTMFLICALNNINRNTHITRLCTQSVASGASCTPGMCCSR